MRARQLDAISRAPEVQRKVSRAPTAGVGRIDMAREQRTEASGIQQADTAELRVLDRADVDASRLPGRSVCVVY